LSTRRDIFLVEAGVAQNLVTNLDKLGRWGAGQLGEFTTNRKKPILPIKTKYILAGVEPGFVHP
jgi:hypothetical protein